MARATKTKASKVVRSSTESTASASDAAGGPAPSRGSVNAWEDDPGTGFLISRPIPNLGQLPLAFTFPRAPQAAGAYQPGTAAFRYWTAAEALRRGADFWAALVPLQGWEVGRSLTVILDEGEDLNAYYDRKALNFFHGPFGDSVVYSGESPDIVCHEMGHAILDSFKPELWDAGSLEVAAFHESFADISAILSALQLPSVRTAILAATGGRLYQSSRLSRLAEQLGAAIRAQAPDAVDPDCLRNAVNSFSYQDPTALPSGAPAAQLSSEPHSFSRVFTAAFYESLSSALSLKAADPSTPTEAELSTVATTLASYLVNGIKAAPVVSNWYAQVAANMILAAHDDPAFVSVLKGVFVRRAILSLGSAADLHTVAQVASFRTAPVAQASAAAVTSLSRNLPAVGLPAAHIGVEGLLFVDAPGQPRRFLVNAAANDATPMDPANGAAAAQAFVDDLFTRGRVDYNDAVAPHHVLGHHRQRLRSHRLIKVEGGAKLERVLFDCGFCAC